MIVSHHVISLKKEFIQEGGSGRKIELKKKTFEEHRVQEPEPSYELVDIVPSLPRRSSKIFYSSERYLGILTEDLEEAFIMRDRDIKNDPKTYAEVMLDVDFEK